MLGSAHSHSTTTEVSDLAAETEHDAQLRESEERFRQLSRRLEVILDGVGDGVTVEDRSGRIVFANDAAAHAAGFASSRALALAPRAIVLEAFDVFDDRGQPFDPATLPAKRALEGIETEPLFVRVRNRATADEHWLSVRSKPILEEDGRPELAVTIWHDVTNRRREEVSARSLARANEALSQSLDHEHALGELAKALVPEFADWCGVDVVDDGSIRAVAVANVDPAKVELGFGLQREFPELVQASAVGDVIRTGQAIFFSQITDADLERDIANPDMRAAVRALELRSVLIVPLKTRERTVGALTMATVQSGRRYDAHDLALAEELGRRAGIAIENALLYRQAQHAIKLRDEFLSIAGHELKTPLTALDLQLQSVLTALKRGFAVTDPQRLEERLVKTIAQARRIGRLVHELLDVSRISSGRLVLERQMLDVARLMGEVVERHASELARAGSEVSFEVEGQTLGEWDPSRLDQVISNLLSNAIKYGGGKPIDLCVAGQGDHVVLSIRDHGIGIPKESQPKIFQRFERAVSERNYGGLGLGLWIVREVVAAHGGTVRFESAAGSGSTFIVELPYSAPN
jgi:PAS domain S-box-containing protein